jgi:hypothetical protein
MLLHRASEEQSVLVATGTHQMRVNRTEEVKARVLFGSASCGMPCGRVLQNRSPERRSPQHDLHLARNHFLPTSEERRSDDHCRSF